MDKRIITRKDVPAADPPYSPAVVCGEFVFVSGQVPVDPVAGGIVSDDFEQQAEQTFQNLEVVLIEAGSSLNRVVKTTAFLTDLDYFPKLNEVYKKHFLKDRPARSCVEVNKLPFGAKVEIEAIAIL